MTIADRIQHLRKARGLSQEELADAVGVSRQAVSKWESEQSIPDIDKVVALSDFFETTTDYLLKGIEPLPSKSLPLNAMVFTVAGTALNATALLVAIVSWFERQELWSVGVGLAMMLAGCAVALAGQCLNTAEKPRALRLFVQVNVWIVAFIPLAVAYNVLCGLVGGFYPIVAPVPRLVGLGGLATSLAVFAAWWVVYIALCVGVDVAVARRMGGRR